MYSNLIFNIIRIRHYTNYPTYLTLFVSTKNKVPIEAIEILFILLNIITNDVNFNISSKIFFTAF
jgi:hypothetical protein